MNERKIPLKILQLEALLRNIPKENPKQSAIEGELSRRKAGYWGETQLDYYLKLLPNENYYIVNDLRLPFKDDYFQIDCLILTRRYCLVIESKNFKGILFFDGVFNQLIRMDGDTEEAFEDPIAQAENIIIKLKSLLTTYFPDLPFDYLISIASPKTKLQTNTEKPDRIGHAYSMAHKIFHLERFYQKEVITDKQAQEICKYLLTLNTPYEKSILPEFNLTRKDLPDGVTCPHCFTQMTYARGRAHCSTCKKDFQEPYLIKVIDYFLLCEPTATNSKLRVFLGFPERHHITHFLRGLRLPISGSGKGRNYHRPDNVREILADPLLLLKKQLEGTQ
ncbi:nuclease-related domain-containing protein [Bacillus sp. EB01]|uniref:nuclease-related domain-containing protein n=1 Tax=Bacillus sp. EB01 TaxID=1347086 RepID=UPI001E2E9C41|nr:nuclease-related domain-containing protein [Bacillus sp. EB01]